MRKVNIRKQIMNGKRVLRKMAAPMLLLGLLLVAGGSARGDGVALTESQVKALCVINFAKYVEWPAGVFPQADTRITIGILGEGTIADDLEQAVKGKTISGRGIDIVRFSDGGDWSRCQVLFVGASEKKRMTEILDRVKAKPVLTVGEMDGFADQGGIINFMKKDGKVRFEIDLAAARSAQVSISSKVLSLADRVSGKL
jgi:hypothetical protein